ncbi:eukaryotic translation initiation factor 4E1 [Drosophila busckii]|uniref:eukaryotic translation initiation factor 4E1 n=1 Tax=Drosophila busckii TaxID=30019 RepID=UPI00083EAC44|nr:eukaryotic translation initiation factor 4E1 [Drosophila busckii]
MYPSNFYQMKNFANPKTMFKSCSNNEEFSTKPVQSCSLQSTRACGSGSGGSSSSSSISYKQTLHATRNELSELSADDEPLVEIGEVGSQPETDVETAAETENETETEEETSQKEPHHPLNSEWTLWYLETDRSKSWEEMLHEVASFNTVENFWSLINHIKTPSEIKVGSDYCLFKKGIRPMWEDEANVKGGRWVITLNKNNKSDLDNFWLDTMLVLIGESCEHAQELCGAVVNVRGKNNKISIWTANGGNEEAALEIGGKLRDGLRMESAYVLQYQLHKDTMAKQGSLVKTIYTR